MPGQTGGHEGLSRGGVEDAGQKGWGVGRREGAAAGTAGRGCCRVRLDPLPSSPGGHLPDRPGACRGVGRIAAREEDGGGGQQPGRGGTAPEEGEGGPPRGGGCPVGSTWLPCVVYALRADHNREGAGGGDCGARAGRGPPPGRGETACGYRWEGGVTPTTLSLHMRVVCGTRTYAVPSPPLEAEGTTLGGGPVTQRALGSGDRRGWDDRRLSGSCWACRVPPSDLSLSLWKPIVCECQTPRGPPYTLAYPQGEKAPQPVFSGRQLADASI